MADSPPSSQIDPQFQALPWVEAPAKPEIADRANIALKSDVAYLDADGTNKLLQLTGNLPEEDSYTIATKKGGWFAIYNFDDIGYVKDDDKIDADELLKSLREGQIASNAERTKQGMDPLQVVGWAVPPHYDPATHNLEYGVTLSSATGTNINYHLRMLGRRGVMDAALITSQETLQADLAEFRQANAGFVYQQGEDYASFKEGDKVSEYGLAALVTGGAAAAALKSGLFAGLLKGLLAFWKIIAVGVIAAFAAIRRFFSRGEKLEAPTSEE